MAAKVQAPPAGKAFVPARRPVAFGTSIRQGSHLLYTPASLSSWRQPPPVPAWVVMEPFANLKSRKPPTTEGETWAIVDCASRKAYGCGKHTQEVLDGLTLYQRLIPSSIPHVSSALYIEATEDALRCIREEFAEARKDSPYAEFDQSDGQRLFSYAYIQTMDENLMVLTVEFTLGGSRLYYYLVYDADDASLALIPSPPEPEPACAGTLKPLPVRRDGGGYELLVISERRVTPPPEKAADEDAWREFKYEDVLYMFTPEGTKCGDPWQVRGLQTPKVMGPFSFEVMFTFKGKAFFVDLSQGMLYFDLPDAADSSVGDFVYMYLPVPCDPRWEKSKPEDCGPRNISRTMRCIGDFIKFVCIDNAAQRVTVWTLDISQKKWLEENRQADGRSRGKGFLFSDIRRHRRFPYGLPRTEPMFPILMPDGSLCLVLPYLRRREEDPKVDCICNLELIEMHDHIRCDLRWWSSLTEYRNIQPVISPSNFFKRLLSPVQLRGGIFM